MMMMTLMKIRMITWLALWKASKLPAMMGMGRERTRTPGNNSIKKYPLIYHFKDIMRSFLSDIILMITCHSAHCSNKLPQPCLGVDVSIANLK